VHSAIDLLGIRALRSLQGEDLTVDIAPEGVLVNNVPVIETDAWCTNGICHAIYMLLLPPGVRAAAV
ncbi:MAG: fasciclin domain-containing protein, partial [Methanoculleus bourgensis]|nr:fasciclin domain-containing protein [Methanoculleus bourgensis]